MLCKNWYLLVEKKIKASPRGSFQNFDEHPRPFYMEAPPRGGGKPSFARFSRTVILLLLVAVQ